MRGAEMRAEFSAGGTDCCPTLLTGVQQLRQIETTGGTSNGATA